MVLNIFDDINTVITLAITLVTFVGTITGLLGALFKNKKLLKFSEQVKLYHELAEDYVMDAEVLFSNRPGKEKLEWVLNRIEEEFEKRGWEFSAEQAKIIIEDIIEVTKKVNFKK